MILKVPNLQIAIDGPVGAGKSVTANLLAKRLGITYVYTGAMYRAVAYIATQNNIDWKDEKAIFEILTKSKIELKPSDHDGRFCNVLINGQDVTDEMFTPKMSEGSSTVAIHPMIRQEMVKQQQRMAKENAVVMEGRDITTTVLPDANLKIYMTADIKLRAARRLRDLLNKGYDKSLEQVLKETEDRDFQDSHRAADPLQMTQDAWVLDTTDLTIEQSVDAIVEELITMGLVAK